MRNSSHLTLTLIVLSAVALHFVGVYLFGELLAGSKLLFVNIEPILNTGLALSLQSGRAAGVILPLATLIFFGWLYFRERPQSFVRLLAFGLVLGAGSANLLERIINGGVTDYFRIGFLPVVNISDILLTVAVGIYIVTGIWTHEDKS